MWVVIPRMSKGIQEPVYTLACLHGSEYAYEEVIGHTQPSYCVITPFVFESGLYKDHYFYGILVINSKLLQENEKKK